MRPHDTLWSIASRDYADPREGVWEIAERNGLEGRRSFRVRCSSCRSAARAAVDSRRGSRRDLPRHGRLDADRTPLALGDPRPTAESGPCSTAPRGHSDSSCGRTSASSTSRRSFSHTSTPTTSSACRDAEDLCAPRARAAAGAGGPRGLDALLRSLRPIIGRLTPRSPSSRSRRRRAPSRRLRAAHVRRVPRARAPGTPSSRPSGPAASTWRLRMRWILFGRSGASCRTGKR